MGSLDLQSDTHLDKIFLFNLVILLKVMHVWLPIKLGFRAVRDY